MFNNKLKQIALVAVAASLAVAPVAQAKDTITSASWGGVLQRAK